MSVLMILKTMRISEQDYTEMKNKEIKQIKRRNDTHFTPTNADAIQY